MLKAGAKRGTNNFGGRKLDGCWQHFKEDEKNKKLWMCNHCKMIISKKVERMRKHLKSCVVFSKFENSSKSDDDDLVADDMEVNEILDLEMERIESSSLIDTESSSGSTIVTRSSPFPIFNFGKYLILNLVVK